MGKSFNTGTTKGDKETKEKDLAVEGNVKFKVCKDPERALP